MELSLYVYLRTISQEIFLFKEKLAMYLRHLKEAKHESNLNVKSEKNAASKWS